MEPIEEIHSEAFRRLSVRACELLAFSERMHKGNLAERVRITYELLKDYKLLPERGAVGKTEMAAKEYRLEGNSAFERKQYENARILYTKAVAHAPIDSQELNFAYGNRSAATFRLKLYGACISDCNQALEFEKQEDTRRSKLEVRKKMCCENEASHTEEYLSPLSEFETNNAEIPCASESLQLNCDISFGRYITATEDILPGKILAIEKPYVTLLLSDQYYVRCYECCKSTDAPIPCSMCVYAMFCSSECRMKSLHGPHKYECSIMDYLIKMDFTKLELLALRTVLKARMDQDSWAMLRTVTDTVESTEPTRRGFVTKGKLPIPYDSKYYESVHSLETNEDKRDASDYFLRAVTSAVFVHLLKKTNFYEACQEEDIWFSGRLFMYHYMTVVTNMHSLDSLVECKGEFLNSENFACGAYPFLSLINHSCNPNVVRISSGTSLTLMALKPIKKGQQIFDNYGHHYATEDYLTRQVELKKQYKFICKCEACVGQWPTYLFLNNDSVPKTSQSAMFELNETVINKLQKGDKNFAKSILQKLYKNVKYLEKYACCKVLADHQETIKQCWALFGNVTYEKK